MSEEKKVVPEIRFPEFTDEWKVQNVGDVLLSLKDGTHETHKNTEKGPYLLSAKNIKNGRIIIEQSDRKISWDEYRKIHSQYKLQTGDVLLTIVGSIGESAVLRETENLTFQRSVAFLRPNNETQSSFLRAEMETDRFQYELQSRKSQSAQPGIYLGELARIPFISAPSILEQARIGSFFAMIDSLIYGQEKLIEDIYEYKKSLLQKMFPKEGEKIPEVRFPEFKGEWEVKELSELLTQRIERKKITEEEPLLAFSYAEGVIDPEDKKSNKRDFLMTDKDNKVFLRTEYDDIIYNPANVIHGAIRRNSFKAGVVSPIYKIFKCNDGVSPKYMGERLHTDSFINEASKYIEGTVIKLRTLSPESFLKMKIEIPKSLEEQEKIGNFFLSIDNCIKLQEKQLSDLQQYKKSLLQKMFC